MSIGALRPGARALDIGGGRGDHGAVWAARGVQAIVLDASMRMAADASRQEGVAAIVGRSEALPFRPGAFDLAYFHLSIHYGDWRAALAEAARVTAPGGRIDVWTLGPRHHRQSHLARWFPRVRELDEARFPDPDDLAAFGETVGRVEAREEWTERVTREAADWADAVRAGFVSTLQLLTGQEVEEGLTRFAIHHPPGSVLHYELLFDRVVVLT